MFVPFPTEERQGWLAAKEWPMIHGLAICRTDAGDAAASRSTRLETLFALLRLMNDLFAVALGRRWFP
jgi:hypothetical protein